MLTFRFTEVLQAQGIMPLDRKRSGHADEAGPSRKRPRQDVDSERRTAGQSERNEVLVRPDDPRGYFHALMVRRES